MGAPFNVLPQGATDVVAPLLTTDWQCVYGAQQFSQTWPVDCNTFAVFEIAIFSVLSVENNRARSGRCRGAVPVLKL